VSELSENGKDDVEGLEANATYVASLLVSEDSVWVQQQPSTLRAVLSTGNIRMGNHTLLT
jgi:hypothetical protein